MGCRQWMQARYHGQECPTCGLPRPDYNTALLSQRWENAMNANKKRAIETG